MLRRRSVGGDRTGGAGMPAHRLPALAVLAVTVLVAAATAPAGTAPAAAQTRTQSAAAASGGLDAARFANPPASSRPTMLWFWNGPMTADLVDRQLAAMRDEGIREVVIFPYQPSRLPTPPTPAFFTEEWFDLVEHALREAARTDMKVWLFNDNWYSSGRAGGLVVDGGRVGDRVYEPHPELRPKSLVRSTVTATGPTSLDVRGSWRGAAPLALSVEDDRLRVDGGGVTLLRGGEEWTDYTVSFDARPLATASQDGIGYAQAGWVFRARDGENMYAWLLGNFPHSVGPDGNLTKIVIEDGISSVERVPVPFDVVAGRSYHVETRLDGDRIETVIDGETVDVTHDSTFSAGTIGFRQHEGNNESATYDNLRVVGEDGTALYEETFDSPDALQAFGPPIADDAVVAVSALPVRDGEATLHGLVDLTQRFRDKQAWQVPDGEFRVEYYTSIPRSDFGGPGYLDLLSDEAIRRYIDVVHEEYLRRFPWAFGTVLRGFWDDEPYLSVVHGGLPVWSDSVSQELAALGATPAEALPAVFDDHGRVGRLNRGDYWRAVMNRFADAYYRQQGEWAEEHGVDFISNPLGDNAPPAAAFDGSGAIMKNHQWAQVPGGDAIFGRLAPGGRTSLKARYAASSAHQNGRDRVLHENFGGYGWDVTPGLARFVNGHLALRGVNLTVLHAYWANPETAAVVHPPPLDPSSTWWPAMDGLADWTGRLMEANLGRATAPTAVLLPQRAVEAWYAGQNGDLRYGGPAGDRIDAGVTEVVHALEDVQVDFDVLDEAALDGDPAARLQARPEGGALRIGPQAYRVVAVPPAPTMSLETVERLSAMARTGGTVIAYGELPTEETTGRDGALREAVADLFGTSPEEPQPSERRRGAGSVAFTDTLEGVQRLAREADAPAGTLTPASDQVRVLRRKRGDDRVLLVMNESDQPVETTATFPIAGTPELWDPDDGSHETATRFFAGGGSTSVPMRLEPFEVTAVAFRKAAPEPGRVPHLVSSKLEATRVAAAGARTVEADVVAESAGRFDLVAKWEGRFYRGTVDVEDRLEPIALDGGWRFRFADREEWVERPLGSWTGLDRSYSGDGVYEKTFTLSAEDLAPGRRALLELGDVRDVAEVEINGRRLGRLLWRPYRVDATEALKAGENVVRVTVTNTPANAHGGAQPSGLLGPVRLRPVRDVRVGLDLDPDAVATGAGAVMSVAPEALEMGPCQRRTVVSTIENLSPRPLTGELTADADAPLEVAPSAAAVEIAGGERATVPFEVVAPAGIDAGSYATRFSFGDGTAEVPVTVAADPNLARAGTASASSTHSSFAVANAINGNRDSDDWGSGNGWNDGTRGQFPDWLQVSLPCASTVGRVELFTLDSSRYPASSFGLRDYDIQVRVGDHWETVAAVRDNTTGRVSSTFAPVTTDAVRVLIGASNDATYSRIVELEIYDG